MMTTDIIKDNIYYTIHTDNNIKKSKKKLNN